MLQGSAAWLEWRRQGIGSSDVPALMGHTEYTTPLEIFRIKRGLVPEQVSNWAMQRGTEAEPRIRALYELEYGVDCPSELMEHSVYPWLRVSLDGYDPTGGGLVLEIKYPGKEKHQEAVEGRVPACYFPQIQYQLAVTGAQKAHYISFDGVGIKVVEVLRDEDYIERMLEVVRVFWERVLHDEPPPLTEDDFLTLDAPEDMRLFNEWKDARLIQMQFEEVLKRAKQAQPEEILTILKDEAKKAEKSLEFYRERVIARAIHPKILCAGVQVLKVRRKKGETWDIRLKETA